MEEDQQRISELGGDSDYETSSTVQYGTIQPPQIDRETTEYKIVNSVDEALDEVQGSNLFFYLWPILINIGHVLNIGTMIPFLLRVPDIQCKTRVNPDWHSCERDFVCDNRDTIQYQFQDNNFQKSNDLNNWITHLDLLCVSEFTKSLFGALFFVGAVIATVTVLRLGDIYGRKPVLIICNIGCGVIFITLYFVDNLVLAYLLVIPIGMFGLAKGALTYLQMLELVPSRLNSVLHTFGGLVASLFTFSATAFFYFVPNARLFLIILGIMCLIHLIPVIKAPESPKFLYTQKRWNELREAINSIAYTNGVKMKEIKFTSELCYDEQEETEVISMREAIKDKVYFKNLLIMTLNWSVCSVCFYVISYYSNDFPGSMFVNVLCMQIADFFSGLCSYIYVKNISLNHGFSSTFIIVFAVTIIYSCFSYLQGIEYLCVFAMRFGIGLTFSLCYFGSSNIFDVQIKSRSFSVHNFFARFFTIGSPVIAQIIPKPVIVISVLTLVSALASQFIEKQHEITKKDFHKDNFKEDKEIR
ncbi:unnamed protein product [Moneuplotes crassus]|uniref:Uncharacterized protein n=1 Tax=Euplotes crassus TaxID=5936 RepID=A0AAD1UA19_EUPCR|nr:unnamed protein product [Moneuplotes crassus]